jgi:hypothetical protein
LELDGLVLCCFERHAHRDDGVDVVASLRLVDAPASPAVTCDEAQPFGVSRGGFGIALDPVAATTLTNLI